MIFGDIVGGKPGGMEIGGGCKVSGGATPQSVQNLLSEMSPNARR